MRFFSPSFQGRTSRDGRLATRLPGVRSASIIPCPNAIELSNNIIEKGLAFGRDWSGTVANSGRQRRPEILPRRLVGRDGASVVRRDAASSRTEDLNVKVCEEAISSASTHANDCRKAVAAG